LTGASRENRDQKENLRFLCLLAIYRSYLLFNNSGNATMKNLQTVTAVIELGAGLALIGFPSAAVALLLGSPLDTPAAVTLGRVAGTALFALGIACWLARSDVQSRAARGLVAAMVFYNFAVVALFAFAGLGLGLRGVALWPAVVLHMMMAVWCIACLRRKPPAKPIEKPVLPGK
jgi:hypothetical protein